MTGFATPFTFIFPIAGVPVLTEPIDFFISQSQSTTEFSISLNKKIELDVFEFSDVIFSEIDRLRGIFLDIDCSTSSNFFFDLYRIIYFDISIVSNSNFDFKIFKELNFNIDAETETQLYLELSTGIQLNIETVTSIQFSLDKETFFDILNVISNSTISFSLDIGFKEINIIITNILNINLNINLFKNSIINIENLSFSSFDLNVSTLSLQKLIDGRSSSLFSLDKNIRTMNLNIDGQCNFASDLLRGIISLELNIDSTFAFYDNLFKYGPSDYRVFRAIRFILPLEL